MQQGVAPLIANEFVVCYNIQGFRDLYYIYDTGGSTL